MSATHCCFQLKSKKTQNVTTLQGYRLHVYQLYEQLHCSTLQDENILAHQAQNDQIHRIDIIEYESHH